MYIQSFGDDDDDDDSHDAAAGEICAIVCVCVHRHFPRPRWAVRFWSTF